MAPHYHAGLRHAMPVRRALRTRTIFNVLGPLVNPAAPAWQVVGVYDPALCVPIARTLGLLGCEAALVVHGAGLDEIALHAPTQAALWRGGEVRELTLTPADAGLAEHPLAALAGASPEENGAWLRALLGGGGAPAHVAAVALNAGALLWISGRAADLREGARQALEVLRAGTALARLDRLVELSRASDA
jgi:anthranilate phosphoribosyltransferase